MMYINSGGLTGIGSVFYLICIIISREKIGYHPRKILYVQSNSLTINLSDKNMLVLY